MEKSFGWSVNSLIAVNLRGEFQEVLKVLSSKFCDFRVWFLKDFLLFRGYSRTYSGMEKGNWYQAILKTRYSGVKIIFYRKIMIWKCRSFSSNFWWDSGSTAQSRVFPIKFPTRFMIFHVILIIFGGKPRKILHYY